jgi:predicted signal transduction protein with EAL and GGDEF domain
LQRAEIAMFHVKEAGRNTARFFSPAQQAAVNARAALEEQLRQGSGTINSSSTINHRLSAVS